MKPDEQSAPKQDIDTCAPNSARLSDPLRRFLPERAARLVTRLADKRLIRELVSYVFWGIVTTVINFGGYWVMLTVGVDYRIANIISMVITKSAAYISNKYFVFRSKRDTKKALAKEVTAFIITRTLSGLIDFFGLILLVDALHMDELFGKVCMIVIVTIVNYVFGKWVVYK